MTEHSIQTEWGKKTIKVYCGDVTELPEQVDLLVCSAFKNGYSPTPSSLIGSLYQKCGISVSGLSQTPSLNLKDLGIWISQPLCDNLFKRIACVEILSYFDPATTTDELRSLYDNLFFAVKKCKMIDFPVKAIAMPVLGTGVQRIEFQKSLIPLLTECMSALKTIQGLQNIILFDKDSNHCRIISEMLRKSTPNTGECMAFISYSHSDQDIANLIANELELNGIKPWIDHKMIRNANYAEDIVKGISESKVFLLLVSRDSLQSPDVRREVRNASVYFDKGSLKIVPVILEPVTYPPEYSYYLTGIDYKDISKPPREQNIQTLCKELRRYFFPSEKLSIYDSGIKSARINYSEKKEPGHVLIERSVLPSEEKNKAIFRDETRTKSFSPKPKETHKIKKEGISNSESKTTTKQKILKRDTIVPLFVVVSAFLVASLLSYPHINNSVVSEEVKAKAEDSNNQSEDSSHVHKWKDATYEEPKTCELCGETEGNVKGYISVYKLNDGDYSDESVNLNEFDVHPWIFNQKLKKCRMIKVGLSISKDIGDPLGTFVCWVLSDGEWSQIGEMVVWHTDKVVEKRFNIDPALDIEAIAFTPKNAFDNQVEWYDSYSFFEAQVE